MHIRAIAAAFPNQQFPTDVIAQWVGMDPNFIVEKIGVTNRYFLSDHETVVELAKKACDNLFRSNPELKHDHIKLLIVVTQNPDYKLPHTSALLQHALGLDNTVACFDVNLGCSGYVYALSIAKGFMLAEGISEGVVVTCDPYSKIIGRTDRDTITIFGDAATATWLSKQGKGKIGMLDFGTDGGRGSTLMVKAGGSAYPFAGIGGVQYMHYPEEDFRLKMDGRAIFNFMMEKVPQSVHACLSKNNTSINDIAFFVFHQANKFFIEQLQKRLDLPPAKVPCNVQKVGNTVSSSIPLLLGELMNQHCLEKQKVLISGFGVGLSWATNVITFGG